MTVESHKRSIAKTISWRIVATIITTFVVYVSTGKLNFALGIGFADTIIKFAIYFIHERIWNKINFGRIAPKNTDYEI